LIFRILHFHISKNAYENNGKLDIVFITKESFADDVKSVTLRIDEKTYTMTEVK